MPSLIPSIHPDLDQLKRRAKELRIAFLRGDAKALSRVHSVPELRSSTPLQLLLTQAQLVIAREQGFPSWPRLKLHIELTHRGFAERVALFHEAVCLVSAQNRGDLRRAREILTHDPEVARADIYAAAASGELPTVERLLAREPALANSPGGARQWPPLLYVCFSGLLRGDAARTTAMVAIARMLLANGADADVRFAPIRDDSGYTESALSGACGVGRNPEMMRLLIAAGARVDGDQSSYCAVESSGDGCLDVLLEHGLPPSQISLGHLLDGEDEAGVRRVLSLGVGAVAPGYSGETPLHWAIKRNRSLGVLTLLLDHGADPNARIPTGHTVFPTIIATTPLELAIRMMNARAYDLLLARGATSKVLDPTERMLLACARGDVVAMRAELAANPTLVATLPMEDRCALPRAAARGDATPVELLLEAGFAISTRGWMGGTALHHAAIGGHLRTVQTLIEAGAELDDRNNDHRSTPLNWAQWGSSHCDDPDRDFAGVVEALIAAGATLPDYCDGSAAVIDALHQHNVPD